MPRTGMGTSASKDPAANALKKMKADCDSAESSSWRQRLKAAAEGSGWKYSSWKCFEWKRLDKSALARSVLDESTVEESTEEESTWRKVLWRESTHKLLWARHPLTSQAAVEQIHLQATHKLLWQTCKGDAQALVYRYVQVWNKNTWHSQHMLL